MPSLAGLFFWMNIKLENIKKLDVTKPLKLDCGKTIKDFPLAYETYGKLNDNKDNAILVFHALTGDQFVTGTNPITNKEGWWVTAVGPGRAIDTNKYFVICANVIGGCMGSLGPKDINPVTKKPYGLDFPVITIKDMVKAQESLLEHLGIKKLLCATGGSMGGFQSMQWAIQFPKKVESIIPIATSPRLTNQALAFDIVGRNAIKTDLNFKKGDYYQSNEKPEDGLAIARMLAHITYVSNDSLKRKFDNSRYDPKDISTEFENRFSVGSYLAYQGSKFVNRFDANSYLYITRAMDYFDLTKQFNGNLSKAFEKTNSKFFVISFTSDWLYPTSENRDIVIALNSISKDVGFIEITSDKGHDSFLLDVPDFLSAVKNFLETSYQKLK